MPTDLRHTTTILLALAIACLLPMPAIGEEAPEGDPVWEAVTSVNTPRSRRGLAFCPGNGMFYLAGGEATGGNRNNPIEEYDPATNTWTDRATLLTGVSNGAAVGVGDLVYVPGGYNGSAGIPDLQIFDPATNMVTLGTPMPAGNFAHAAAVLGTDIHVLGGSSTGVAGTTHYIYDTVAGSWSTGAPVPFATNYPAAASDGTYVYVLGGTTTNLPNVERYDPGTDSWSTMPPMLTGRGGPGAFWDGRFLWAVGGGWSTYLTSTEYFD
ncbi:MAG TPA: hypothetical protein VLA66_04840, partial [Thermoanaerobaculia bacterium]|nr:hypothetical protein [Thermoanaerobaculia bacterium]